MSDPKKEFMCTKCGNIINDTQRMWGKESNCPNCFKKDLFMETPIREFVIEDGKYYYI